MLHMRGRHSRDLVAVKSGACAEPPVHHYEMRARACGAPWAPLPQQAISCSAVQTCAPSAAVSEDISARQASAGICMEDMGACAKDQKKKAMGNLTVQLLENAASPRPRE